MSKNNTLLKIAQKHVFNMFKQNEKTPLIYHNYNHTVDVVNASDEIGSGSGLSKDEIELLMLAAWFHDTGYLVDAEGHEEISAKFASEFLHKQNYPDKNIRIILAAIRATNLTQKPKTLLEEVLCDADLAHLGKKDYLEKCQLLKFELDLMDRSPKEDNWPKSEINFLSTHNYYTEYAQREFSKRKAKNILLLQELRHDKVKKTKKRKEKVKKSKSETPERGIETMFRVTFKNHMDLSSIADNKANIMLSINAIIISISLSTLIPNFDARPTLIIPSSFLLLICVLTIIFATLSTRPKISTGKFTREDVKQKKPNLLFFGNFHAMPLQEFEWGMEEMMKSKQYLYGSMIKDIYSLGTVLAKKFKYLRICYNIFMYGMILAVVLFLIAFLFN